MTDRLTGIEVNEFAGQAADPPVSGAGRARMYYNSSADELRASTNGAAYAPIGSGGGGGGPAQPHDTTFSPVGLWQFDGDLTDSSGNGLDLAIETGDEKYTDILPGLRGFIFDGSTALARAVATAALTITGDLTVELLALFPGALTAARVLFEHGVSGSEVEADNILYRLTFGDTIFWQYLAEEGAGTNILYTLTTHGQPLVVPMHVAMVRSSNQVQFYLNGKAIGAASVGLNAPTGGGNGRLFVGSASGGTNAMPANTVFSSFKLVASALSAANILSEYNRTLGPVYGNLT